MARIDGYQIVLVAGDTLHTTIRMRCKADGTYTDYEPAEGDIIQFIVKDGPDEETSILTKSIPTDTLELELSSQETSVFTPRRTPYPYSIKLTTSEGVVDTFIKGALYIVE